MIVGMCGCDKQILRYRSTEMQNIITIKIELRLTNFTLGVIDLSSVWLVAAL